MAVTLTDTERAVLEAFRDLGEDDPDGAWTSYYVDVAKAAGSLYSGDAVCRDLRRRKLLEGQGRGQHASYWISDKGREAIA